MDEAHGEVRDWNQMASSRLDGAMHNSF